MPLFLKFDLLKEFNEFRGVHAGTAEARLLGEPISHWSQRSMGCEELSGSRNSFKSKRL
jgi:hypothetical protein